MIADPWFYVAATFSVILIGFGKGAFGGGMGVLGVPVMALFLPPTQVAAILLPLLCAMDIFGIWKYRKSWDKKTMMILVPAVLLGVLIGSLSFRYLDDNIIKFLVGFIAVSFCFDTWRRRKMASTPLPANVAKGGFWGVVSGLTSFVAHAGGPPVNVYLLPLKLEKTTYVGTSIILFTMLNYVKLVPYSLLGLFTEEVLWTALVLAPLVPLGMLVGIFAHSKIERDQFYRVVYALLFLVGWKLMYDGGMGYWAGVVE